MATITLTDRVSVRVTAKDSTETSNQNKTNGGNVASALGGSGLTDSEKEELGESLGETVTDEDGKTYARSDKVAGVLKQLSQDGKLSESETTYKFGNVACIEIPTDPSDANGRTLADTGLYYGYNTGANKSNPPNPMFGPVGVNNIGYPVYLSSINHTDVSKPVYAGWIHNINNDTYRLLYSNGSGRSTIGEDEDSEFVIPENPQGGTGTDWLRLVGWGSYSISDYDPISIIPCTDVGQELNSLSAYGDLNSEQSGGAPLDPTGKSDAQIQKDLEDLAALENCSMTMDTGDTYIAVTDANGNPIYFLGT